MLTFDAEKHEYRHGGALVPSVTQIIDSHKLIDSTWFTDDSRDLGTYVHQATELDDRPDVDLDEATIHERIRPYLEAWRQFRQDARIPARCIYAIEEKAYSEIYRFAGTIDRVVMLGCQETVIDIKTGQPAKWHRLQTAAYNILRPAATRRACVYLAGDGRYHVRVHADTERDTAAFVAAVKSYHAAEALRNWRTSQ